MSLSTSTTLLRFVLLGCIVYTGSTSYYGRDFYNSFFRPLSADLKTKVETLGAVLKRHVQRLRTTENGQVELVFLVDSSSSVGAENFFEELRFVRKLLADFTVDSKKTRVSLITFSSRGKVIRQVDHMSHPTEDKHKCRLLGEELPRINYIGGGTYTLGAFLEAKVVLKAARQHSTKAIFLITDGFSNGGDPRPEAKALRELGVKIFTFGIRNGNFRELFDMASAPKNETCYILDTFEEFEALARRALHEDLHTGSYVGQPKQRCNILCKDGGPCCHVNASCMCGTHTGKYECQCKPGYYGSGIGKYGCLPCPPGTYKNVTGPGDVSTCNACPDENQTTGSGTASVTDCSCKKGFVNMNTSECGAFTCPALDPPGNGYFVNNKCHNVYNAACGLRCKPGYELQGSSLRICLENGTWSGVDTSCITKTCPPLPTPKDGQMICSRDDFSYSTVCRFTCDTGYKLMGSRKRTCLAIALWTGITTRCREITCQPLTPVKDGNVQPVMCTAGEVSFGTTCQMSCLPGYTMYGPHAMQCTPDGNWAPAVNKYNQCLDEKAPFLECPADIEVAADDDDSTSEVTWQLPVSVDNSGFLPKLTAEPAVSPPSRFHIGSTAVTYISEDFSQNRAKCLFTVTVVDKTPPTVDRCFSPSPVVSADKFGNATWDEPIFSDNSEGDLNITRSHDPGWFPLGITKVTITATDESGNINTCVLEINVIPHPCEFPDPPVNGNRTCHETDDGVYCTISCHPGYAFAIPPADNYYCAYDNIWKPEDKIPFPDCSEKKISNDIVQPASVKFTGKVPCREKKILHKIEKDFEQKVSSRVSELCEENFICSVDDIQTTCEEEADFNKIHINLENRRRRRSLADFKKKLGHTQRFGQSLVTFDFMLEGTVAATGNDTEDDRRQEAMTTNLKNILTTLQEEARAGTFNFNLAGSEMNFENMTFNPLKPKFMCPEGLIQLETACVYCPIGTYFNVIRKACEGCPVGTYQPIEGSVSCLVCPDKSSTLRPNAKTSMECKAMCLPGSFSENGLERCETCATGFYQTEYAQEDCSPCPTNTTTRRRGSRVIAQCKERCPPGYVSKTGLVPCLPCPVGTFQQEVGQSACFRCPQGALTTRSAATSVMDCEGDWDIQSDSALPQKQQQLLVNLCFDEPCQNGGTCVPTQNLFKCNCPPGYEGLVCGTPVDQCNARPCLNNGTCTNLQVDYACRCVPGFEGKKCEVNLDECEKKPCKNGGTCVDGANAYTCNCPSGFQGATCEENINDCSGNPCLHGGTCNDDVSGYTCTCQSGYTGETCEIEVDECLEDPCENGVCHDEVDRFRCECPRGYTGERCESNIDDCAPMPCANGAKCEDLVGGYTCHCLPDFTGTNCDSPLDKNYQMDFPSSGTGHVQIPLEHDLSVITVSFWMKTDDKINQGTPFSYAIPGSDNALTLTDYDGFALVVNEEKVMTDEPTNDGLWHHIVVTWSANRGSWKLYIDGLLSDSGFDLSTGKPIKGGGVFVIGQEQDSVGGTFDPREAFVGSLAHMNMWDRELPLDTIDTMRIQCTEQYGNIIAWPDVRRGIRGTVKDASSTFCGDCPTPNKPDYGDVEVEGTSPGSTIVYSCIRGFQLAGWDRLQCLATGEWDNAPPTCQKISCGYPGSIKNGFIEGLNYDYDNRVRYQCTRGFKLVGPKTRYCNEYGEWENDEPECKEVTCELPLLSENTRISNPKNAYRPRSVVTFECTPGNRLLTPHNSVRCQSDGTWDKSVPTCDPLFCSAPPDITNGGPSSTPEESFVGVQINYECDFGHRFAESSPTKVTCLPTGKWDTNLPVCEVMECPEPPVVAHAEIIGDSYYFLDQIEYLCDEGYERIGDDIIECLETGEWTEEPACEPVDCGEPNELANGVITGIVYILNSAISYECDTGYKLKGLKRRLCLTNSSWSGADPVCKPVVCGKPGVLTNGRVIAKDITYRSIAKFQCDEGYTLVGALQMLCQDDGTWSNELPVCNAVECNYPIDIANGYFELSGTSTFGQTVTYYCNTGYELVGASLLSCESSGEWSEEFPFCEIIKCEHPGEISNGNVNVPALTYNSKAEYSCARGYEVIGEAIRTCQADKLWSGEVVTCNPLRCSSPEYILNGQLDYKDLTYGSIVRYSCNPGYELLGEEVRRCQEDLLWSHLRPTCRPVNCAELELISYGEINSTETVYLTVVAYSCYEGYILTGNNLRTCSETRAWTGVEPTCEAVECDKPAAVTSNGRMHGNNFTFGAMISYECDEGYDLRGEQNRTCQANAEWDVPIPICEIVECPRAKIKNGRVSTFQREFNSVVEYSCKRGYKLEGPATRTCLASGLWSGEDPICRTIVCPVPPLLIDGTVTMSLDGLTITHSCEEGFNLSGPEERQCQQNETWSLSEPKCIRITCPDLSSADFDHGQIILTSLVYGSYATYECDDGYNLIGERQRQCTAEGLWSVEAPFCEIISCGPPGAFVNGIIEGTEFTHGSVVTYTCNRGFELKGESSRRCEADALWYPSTPRCHSIVCPQVPDIANGRSILQANTVDGTVRYMCNPGFVIQGDQSRVCLETGEWGGTEPVCLIMECPGPPELAYGQVLGDSFALGRFVQFVCDEGYELIGESMSQCLPTLFWSNTKVVCQKITCRALVAPINGRIDVLDFSFGETAVFSCLEGYYLYGESTAVCQADATWSIEIPTCLPVSCGDPPAVPNARADLQNGTVFGSAITLVCDAGYNPVGDPLLDCSADATWSEMSFSCEIISCPTPLSEHLIVEGDVTFGSSVSFKCEVGYELVGVSSTCRCMADGSWDAPFPSCEIITCVDPEPFHHGSISNSDFTYGNQIVYTCDIGFEIIGDSARTCQEDKKWSGQAPMCMLIKCPDPESRIPNGRLIFPKPSYSYNDEATYACDKGYEMIGDEKIRCLETKFWSSVPPSCAKILCPKPGRIRNGHMEATDEVITYVCDSGYELMGSQVRRCLHTGRWDQEAPLCLPVQCPDPALINNGEIEGSDFTFGQTVTYKCNEGFKLAGDSSRQCQASAAWSGTSPICEHIVCVMPRPPDHGSVFGASYMFGDIIEFKCDFGHRLVGEQQLRCEANGLWDAEVPYCATQFCLSPPFVRDGQFSSSSEGGRFPVGVTVTYTCNKGYQMEGAAEIICSEDQAWSEEAPTCTLVSCSPVTEIEYGLVIGRRYTYNSVISFQCIHGYDIDGYSSITCLESGFWEYEIPVCRPVNCDDPGAVINGGFSLLSEERPGGQFEFQDEIAYHCDAGYNLVGSDHRECTAAGEWTGRKPDCIIINCGEPPAVDHSSVIGEDFDYGRSVSYTCNEGYNLRGNSIIECVSSGEWLGGIPQCELIECGPPPVFDHASATVTRQDLVQTAEYFCDSGYNMEGSPHAVCDLGKWAYDFAFACIIVDCGHPPSAENVEVQVTQTTVYSRATYSCHTGYTLSSGKYDHMCQEDGTWEADLPVCIKVFCGAPVSSYNFSGTDYSYGGIIYYECPEGHELSGSSHSECLETGFWSETSFECEEISCGPPSSDVQFRGEDFSFEGVVTYECPEGYQMDGEAVLTCQANGRWSGLAPQCHKISCGAPPDGPGYTGTDFTFTATIHYTCEEGFEMFGEADIICQANGEWNHQPPTCEKIYCGMPPSEVEFTGEDFFYGAVVDYRCPEGYNMAGDEQLECGANGEWLGIAPSCLIAECGRPPQDVPFRGVEFTYGAKIEFFCHEGYDLIGEQEVTCQSDGSWSETGQICIKVNCGIPSTEALFEGSDFSFGGVVRYYCEEGYSLVGEEVIRCQADGTWSSTGHICTPIDCGEVRVPINADVVSGDPKTGTLYTNVIEFSCKNGFSLSGISSITCLVSGRWSEEPPTCELIFADLCDLAVDLSHAGPVSSGHKVGDSIEVPCQPGFQAQGPMTSRCEEGGRWTIPSGVCIAIETFCLSRADVPNSKDIPPGSQVGDTVALECEAGFQPQGDMTAECLDSGLWSPATGYCRKVYCGRPKVRDLVNVMLIGRSYFYGDHVMYICRPGLTPSRIPPRLTCQGTGEWDGEPSCAVQCKQECLNGGRCMGQNRCKCLAGYGGKRCEKAICILPCLNGGSCAAPYQCKCPPGYEGTRCQRPICSKPCKNGGRCLSPNRCQCSKGFLPPFCEVKRINRFG